MAAAAALPLYATGDRGHASVSVPGHPSGRPSSHGRRSASCRANAVARGNTRAAAAAIEADTAGSNSSGGGGGGAVSEVVVSPELASRWSTEVSVRMPALLRNGTVELGPLDNEPCAVAAAVAALSRAVEDLGGETRALLAMPAVVGEGGGTIKLVLVLAEDEPGHVRALVVGIMWRLLHGWLMGHGTA
eukprot:261830-Chlamydomonas_euryale.AAC.4